METSIISERIRQKAYNLGFNAVGFSKAEKLEGFEEKLDDWLQKKYHGDMYYMANNKEKRINPTLLVSDTQSIISLLISYYPKEKQNPEVPQIAKYAYGTDYHFVLKDKMQSLWEYIQTIYPNLQGRIFVDSAPISDKLWAQKSGLGWIGKNSCLINKKLGSFFFIAEMLVNIELEYTKAIEKDYCGKCTKCIDACPTGAIVKPRTIDSRKCISYITIENKEQTISPHIFENIGNRMFGCDMCQDVCPWNNRPIITQEPAFDMIEFIKNATTEDWQNLEKAEFNKLFKNSPLKRSKYSGIQRNISFLHEFKKQRST